jgi:hypothetical protein
MTTCIRRIFALAVISALVSACHGRPPESAPSRNGEVRHAPVGEQEALRPSISWFRLIAFGYEGDDRTRLDSARGTASCCEEIRSGWLTFRGSFWVAVDTIAERTNGPEGTTGVRLDGPFKVLVDSGLIVSNARGDTSLFRSALLRALPAAGLIGISHGDTLKITTAYRKDAPFIRYDLIRMYVKVRQ